MRHLSSLFGLVALGSASSLAAKGSPAAFTAIYSNEEQVYFAREAKLAAPPLVYLKVEKASGENQAAVVTAIDAFGNVATVDAGLIHGVSQMIQGDARFDPPRFSVTEEGGPRYELRRARPATCWVAIKKDAPKPDGSADWFFAAGVKLHDQGGRAMVGGGDSGAAPLVIRMRNVVWPAKADGTPNSNKPSVVLYIHKPEKPDSAESYVWADPGAARVGINLRWMQASCGIDGMEKPLAVSAAE